MINIKRPRRLPERALPVPDKRILLRLPPRLYGALVQMADQASRSINNEMVVAIEQHVAALLPPVKKRRAGEPSGRPRQRAI